MLKSQHVEEEINTIQTKIKSNTAETQDITLLNNLIKIKNKISNLVGRSGFLIKIFENKLQSSVVPRIFCNVIANIYAPGVSTFNK